jgi:hypothetical protein
VLQCIAFQKFHDDERLAVFFADIMNRADIRMMECGSSFRLALKSFQRLRVFGQFVR